MPYKQNSALNVKHIRYIFRLCSFAPRLDIKLDVLKGKKKHLFYSSQLDISKISERTLIKVAFSNTEAVSSHVF